jgi:uncharacterized protein (DUF488 family)
MFTIDHSNRPMEEFLALLKKFKIQTLVDIRRFPSSRRFPYFNRCSLELELPRHQIHYHWLKSLGGRQTSVMWAEKLFRQYHRKLLSDYLSARRIVVRHVLGPGELLDHRLNPEARIDDQRVLYLLPLFSYNHQSQR